MLLGRELDCSECHPKPAHWDDVGHILDASGKAITAPVPVSFGAAAMAGGATPVYDRATGTCTNVACHDRKTQTWTPGQVADCTSCHGKPPTGHDASSTDCVRCHALVVDAAGKIIDPVRHMNGHVELGNDSGTCSACHGDATSPAPPRDVAGSTSNTVVTVGAHRNHLGAHQLRGPIACNECHVTVTKPGDPGHLDHGPQAVVFPAGLIAGLAIADGASASWDHASATCSGVYCHGGGSKLSGDTSPTLMRTPKWTAIGTGQAACGTCHGVPPTTAPHTPAMSLLTCVQCHPSTIDANGSLIVTGAPGAETSTHINGRIDVTP
jgi:predicted CxxxxCH...CXXCH cytochrome family protein